MKHLLVAGLLSAMTATAAAQSARSRLTDAEVNQAIQAGQAKKLSSDLVWSCVATIGFTDLMKAPTSGGVQQSGNFDVTVMTEKGQIASLAAEAKRLYKTFSIANVTPQMRMPAIYVRATAQKPEASGSTLDVTPPAEAIVLKSKVDAAAVVRSASFTAEPVEWTNMFGGKIHGANGLGRFAPDSVNRLPPGDIDVVVIAAAGERHCKMGAKDRKAVLGS